MPKIPAKELIGLPVETQHNVHVGKVIDIEIDVDRHSVLKYVVASGTVVQQLLKDQPRLFIDPTQVVSITAEKMIVVDLESGETVNAFEEIAEKSAAQTQRGVAAVEKSETE